MKKTILYLAFVCSCIAQSKLYVAESTGKATITADGNVTEASIAQSFQATDTTIWTGEKSHQALVYSNGSAAYVGENTKIVVDEFSQERFEQQTPEIEPSRSTTQVNIDSGFVGVCSGKLVTGSVMNYKSKHGTFNSKGGKFAMQVDGDKTTAYLLEGGASVIINGKSTLLQPGEQIEFGKEVKVSAIADNVKASIDEKISAACKARYTVLFQAAGAGAQQTVEATPVTPSETPTNIVVSPDKVNQ